MTSEFVRWRRRLALRMAKDRPDYRQKHLRGIEKAKQRGVHFGRPRNGFARPTRYEEILDEFGRSVLDLLRVGCSQHQIARRLSCSRHRIYRTVRNLKQKGLWKY